MNTPATRKSNNSSLEIVIAALKASLKDLRRATDIDYTGERAPNEPVFDSPRRLAARQSISEAITGLSEDIVMDPIDALRHLSGVLREVQFAASGPDSWAKRREYLLEHVRTALASTHNLTCEHCGPALQQQQQQQQRQDDAVAGGIAAVQGAASKEFESAVMQGFTEATTPGPVQAPQTATAAKASYYASVASVPRPAAPSPDAMRYALDAIREIDSIMDRMEELTGLSVRR